ncbi:MAG: DUF1524 domain-containing protein, partial [Actinomycetales bacterium]|nr:DUF1524 domain-containing protein [Actinomycetales bacterium]
PGASWGTIGADPKFDDYVQRVGNLLILEHDINTSIKNKDFPHKKANSSGKDYAHSHLKLPHTLVPFESSGTWDFASIDARQADLADIYAASVWPLI